MLLFGLILGLFLLVAWPLSRSDDDDNPREVIGIILLTIGVVALFVMDFINVVSWRSLAATVVVYFLIGTGWFIWKWRALILAKLEEAKASYERRATGSKDTPLTEWAKDYRPAAYQHKEQIAGWIVLWPWSMSWMVLQWPWRLAVKIAEWTRGIADRMVENLWKV